MVKRFSFLLVALCLVIGAGVLIGCNNPTSGFGELEGTWVSGDGDSYIITATTVTYVSGFDMDFAGTIAKHRTDGANAGYIIIRFTQNDWNDGPLGNYYVIHYKGLTSTSVQMASAWKQDGQSSMPSAAAAEEEFTVEKGYFNMYGTYTK